MFKLNKKGQATTETVVVIAIVVAIAIAVGPKIQKALTSKADSVAGKIASQ